MGQSEFAVQPPVKFEAVRKSFYLFVKSKIGKALGLPNAYVKLLNTTEYCYNTEYYYVSTLSSNSSKI